MVVIERNDTAILYTGDIRSEPWFVNSIARNPALIEYTSGIRRLHKVYLDTSFTENVPFQTKRDGIAELLQKVKLYPPDTVFYFQTWTYGYEEVWLALSKALKSQVCPLNFTPLAMYANSGRYTWTSIRWAYILPCQARLVTTASHR